MFKGNNMNEEIILKSEDGVGIITLNRPERLNALTYNIIQKMNDFLDKCRTRCKRSKYARMLTTNGTPQHTPR